MALLATVKFLLCCLKSLFKDYSTTLEIFDSRIDCAFHWSITGEIGSKVGQSIPCSAVALTTTWSARELRENILSGNEYVSLFHK